MIGAEIELAAPIGARDSPLEAYTEAPNFSAGRRQFGKKNRPPERDKRIKPPFSTSGGLAADGGALLASRLQRKTEQFDSASFGAGG
jgi:hypothetical protein